MENDTENKYLIDSESYNTFDNITRFAKNLTLKDSKTLYNNESAASEEFGRLLLKYYDFELTNEDIVSLVKLVNKYNTQVESKINKSNIVNYTLGIDDAPVMVSNNALILRAINAVAKDSSEIKSGLLYRLYNNENGTQFNDPNFKIRLNHSESDKKIISAYFNIDEIKDMPNIETATLGSFVSIIKYYKDRDPYSIYKFISKRNRKI